MICIGVLMVSGCGSRPRAASPTTPPSLPTNLSAEEILGHEVFSTKCTPCHITEGGAKRPGPPLIGIADIAVTRASEIAAHMSAEDYLRESINNPGNYIVETYMNLMPTNFEDQLTPKELDALVAYMLTLKE